MLRKQEHHEITRRLESNGLKIPDEKTGFGYKEKEKKAQKSLGPEIPAQNSKSKGARKEMGREGKGECGLVSRE